jgi:hypothetical protein
MTDDEFTDAHHHTTRDHHAAKVAMTAQPSAGSDPAPDTPVAEGSAHRRRCKSLPPMQNGEAERLVADFLARKAITACPTRYAVRVEQRSKPTRSGY